MDWRGLSYLEKGAFMKNLAVIIAVVLGLLFLSPSAEAKKQMKQVDMGEMTCDDFVTGVTENADDPATIAIIIMWIDGYLSAQTGDTVVNFEDLEANTLKLIAYCKQHPKKNMIEAAEEVDSQ
jgi:hypothetical protein